MLSSCVCVCVCECVDLRQNELRWSTPLFRLTLVHSRVDWQYKTKLIKNNFVRIVVVFDSYSKIEFVESPAMTVSGMTSSVGGMLSLLMAVTITFAVEVIDFAVQNRQILLLRL